MLRTERPDLTNNHNFHKMVVDCVDIEYRRDGGSIAGDKVWLFDFGNPEKNEFRTVGLLNLLEKYGVALGYKSQPPLEEVSVRNYSGT